MRLVRFARPLLAAALWVVLAVYAGRVVHDFYAHVDRAVYAAVDDGEANIAYSVATQGAYSFPASPVLSGMSRMHGQFNYGPWYFYLAGAIVWLFGYSLTAVRSIHLWVVVSCVTAAVFWFRGRGRAAAAGLFGFGFLFMFDTIEWPMARPDSLVTLFAVAMTIAAGYGIERRRPFAWCVVGLAAACGAFTHLIAVSLVFSSVALCAVFAFDEWHGAQDRAVAWQRIRVSALALAVGLALGAAMFYASFGFDLAVQWRFLTSYREITATGETYTVALMRHFRTAFGYVPVAVQRLVWLTLALAWITTLAALIGSRSRRRLIFAYVMPPTVIWTLYFLSNGTYTNYHQGYAILHHAMFFWTAAALVAVACELAGDWSASIAVAISTLAIALVLGQGVRQLRWQTTASVRAAQAEHHVPFSEYADRVIGAMPRRSLAWGSVFFGIESPDRVQLVQQDDAMTLWQRLDSVQRAAFVPEFLVWGYPEVRDDAASALAGGDTRIGAMSALMLGSRFRLASLVDGSPYGVTRVYARVRSTGDDAQTLPSVAMYDDVHRAWLDRVGPVLPVAFHAVAPVTLRIGYEVEPRPAVASATFAAQVPPGQYLVTVRVKPGAGTGRRLIAVTSSTMLRQTINELGPRPKGDFAGYLAGDRDVVALSSHPVGMLYVSQFDANSGAAIESVTVSPVLDLLNPGEHDSRAQPLPRYTRWIPMPGIQMMLKDDQLRVEGDSSTGGYQLYSSLVPATPGERVEADVPNTVVRGQVCAGVLNARGQFLLLANEWREQFDFVADSTGGFRIVFANCQTSGNSQQSRVELLPGSFTIGTAPSYADHFARVALDRTPLGAVEPPRPAPARFPEQPRIIVEPADAAAVKPFLLRSKPRYVDNETRLLVGGRLDRGGLVIGFLSNGTWVSRMTVTEPGEFIAILAPEKTGVYSVAVATEAPPADTVATLTRVDLLPPVRPAK